MLQKPGELQVPKGMRYHQAALCIPSISAVLQDEVGPRVLEYIMFMILEHPSYKGSAWLPVDTRAPKRKIYLSANS